MKSSSVGRARRKPGDTLFEISKPWSKWRRGAGDVLGLDSSLPG